MICLILNHVIRVNHCIISAFAMLVGCKNLDYMINDAPML